MLPNRSLPLNSLIINIMPLRKLFNVFDNVSVAAFLEPFVTSLPPGDQAPVDLGSPYSEPWFQGRIPRQQVTILMAA